MNTNNRNYKSYYDNYKMSQNYNNYYKDNINISWWNKENIENKNIENTKNKTKSSIKNILNWRKLSELSREELSNLSDEDFIYFLENLDKAENISKIDENIPQKIKTPSNLFYTNYSNKLVLNFAESSKIVDLKAERQAKENFQRELEDTNIFFRGLKNIFQKHEKIENYKKDLKEYFSKNILDDDFANAVQRENVFNYWQYNDSYLETLSKNFLNWKIDEQELKENLLVFLWDNKDFFKEEINNLYLENSEENFMSTDTILKLKSYKDYRDFLKNFLENEPNWEELWYFLEDFEKREFLEGQIWFKIFPWFQKDKIFLDFLESRLYSDDFRKNLENLPEIKYWLFKIEKWAYELDYQKNISGKKKNTAIYNFWKKMEKHPYLSALWVWISTFLGKITSPFLAAFWIGWVWAIKTNKDFTDNHKNLQEKISHWENFLKKNKQKIEELKKENWNILKKTFNYFRIKNLELYRQTWNKKVILDEKNLNKIPENEYKNIRVKYKKEEFYYLKHFELHKKDLEKYFVWFFVEKNWLNLKIEENEFHNYDENDIKVLISREYYKNLEDFLKNNINYSQKEIFKFEKNDWNIHRQLSTKRLSNKIKLSVKNNNYNWIYNSLALVLACINVGNDTGNSCLKSKNYLSAEEDLNFLKKNIEFWLKEIWKTKEEIYESDIYKKYYNLFFEDVNRAHENFLKDRKKEMLKSWSISSVVYLASLFTFTKIINWLQELTTQTNFETVNKLANEKVYLKVDENIKDDLVKILWEDKFAIFEQKIKNWEIKNNLWDEILDLSWDKKTAVENKNQILEIILKSKYDNWIPTLYKNALDLGFLNDFQNNSDFSDKIMKRLEIWWYKWVKKEEILANINILQENNFDLSWLWKEKQRVLSEVMFNYVNEKNPNYKNQIKDIFLKNFIEKEYVKEEKVIEFSPLKIDFVDFFKNLWIPYFRNIYLEKAKKNKKNI